MFKKRKKQAKTLREKDCLNNLCRVHNRRIAMMLFITRINLSPQIRNGATVSTVTP